MKEKFDDLKKQYTYISKLVKNNTDIEMNCQLCGSPEGKIRHNPDDPYKIHIICKKCSSEQHLNNFYRNYTL